MFSDGAHSSPVNYTVDIFTVVSKKTLGTGFKINFVTGIATDTRKVLQTRSENKFTLVLYKKGLDLVFFKSLKGYSSDLTVFCQDSDGDFNNSSFYRSLFFVRKQDSKFAKYVLS